MSHPGNGARTGIVLATALSLLPTPTLLFVSTTNGLFLNNQIHFDGHPMVLAPFLAAFVVTLVIGAVLHLQSNRAPALIWCYYLAGPVFALYSLIRGVLPEMSLLIVSGVALPLLWVVAAVRISSRVSLISARPVLALIGTGLLLFEGVTFGVHWEGTPETSDPSGLPTDTMAAFKISDRTHAANDLPNIYHILFDGFQTDGFEYALPETIRNETLSGFTFYSDATTVYDRTRMSLPSVFLGEAYQCDQSHADYKAAQYASEQSFLYNLVREGYATYRFYGYTDDPDLPTDLFDYSVPLKSLAEKGELNQTRYFWKLWMAATFPPTIALQFMDSVELNGILNANIATPKYPLESASAFKKILSLEENLPAKGRYTFMHLMVPHAPLVLDAECAPTNTPNDERWSEGPIMAQNACAGKMLRDFVALLKRLNRYEDSVIIVHGDHGSGIRYIDGELEPVIRITGEPRTRTPRVTTSRDDFHRARCRTLLLVKDLADGTELVGCTESTAPVCLLDVAPTILDSVGLKPGAHYPGWSLLDASTLPTSRTRYYYVVSDAEETHYPERMTEYTIAGASDTLALDNARTITNCED